jgi:hypothetical protein
MGYRTMWVGGVTWAAPLWIELCVCRCHGTPVDLTRADLLCRKISQREPSMVSAQDTDE